MIIDSGGDFLLLTIDRFEWEDGTKRVFAILMDGDLSYCGTKEITSEYAGEIDGIADAILDAVDNNFVRYFAIVEQCDRLPDYMSWSDGTEWCAPSNSLEASAGARGLHLISHVFVTDDSYWSTGPAHGFRSYGMQDTLPSISVTRPERYAGTRMAGGALYESLERGLDSERTERG